MVMMLKVCGGVYQNGAQLFGLYFGSTIKGDFPQIRRESDDANVIF
jgi:hypothetical protein